MVDLCNENSICSLPISSHSLEMNCLSVRPKLQVATICGSDEDYM